MIHSKVDFFVAIVQVFNIAMNNTSELGSKGVPGQDKYPPVEVSQMVKPETYTALNTFLIAAKAAETMPYARQKFQIFFGLIVQLGNALLQDLADCKTDKCTCCNTSEHISAPKHRHHLYDAMINLSTVNITGVIIGLIRALVPSVNEDFFQIAINALVGGRKSIDDECRNPTDVVLYLAMYAFHPNELKLPALEGCNMTMTPNHREIMLMIVTKSDIKHICQAKGGGYSYATDHLKTPRTDQVTAWYHEFFIGGALFLSKYIAISNQLALRPEYKFLQKFLVRDMQYEINSISCTLVGQQIDKKMNDTVAYPMTCVDSTLSATERDAGLNKYKSQMTQTRNSRLLLCEWMVHLGYSYDWIAICLLEGLLIPKVKK